MIVELIHGAALLLALSFFYQVIIERAPAGIVGRAWISGLLFGGICVVGMASPLVLAEGVIVDARSVILSLAGLFCGPLAAAPVSQES